jgi:hypothetical protein
VLKPTYKIGDRVRVKRKTPHAACLKKGDVVQIEAIHPHNGSCKFWNELTESWGYLYRHEFVLLPRADNYDSVSSKAQIDDTEYTVPLADNYDSVSSKAQIVDTEYTVPLADTYDSVSKAISTYRPRGTACSGEYFRFSYRDGLRMRHIHIRGGNTDSPIAQAKVQELRSLLVAGEPPQSVAEFLKNFP